MANVISGGQLASLESPQMSLPSGWPVELRQGVPLTFEDLTRLGLEQPEQVWQRQPSIRKVVDFIARAIASTPLKVYERVSDTDRQRVTGHPVARVLALPSPGVVPYRWLHSIVVDWLLYDRWCVAKVASGDPRRPLDLVQVQSTRVKFGDDGLRRVTKVWVDGKQVLDPTDCLLDHGYAPMSGNGLTPMMTLQLILAEAREALEYRRSVWKNQARTPTVIVRPETAPQWSQEAKERFLGGWAAYAKDGGREGKTPILEDGMTLATVNAFKPRDTNDLEGRQLNDAEVASAYHIAPELVGARQGNYSNMQAFREALYGDALGPYYEPLQQVINTMLVPDLDDTGDLYVEFDIEAKMRGSFATQAAVISTSVGRPWLTAAEARARANLPDLGGDTHSLVTPLNVLVGGQASPRDSGTQNTNPKGSRALTKARAASTYEKRAASVLSAFFARQRAEVLKALGSKASGDWWDGEKWNDALADDIYRLSTLVSSEIGAKTAEALGFDADDYDVDRTLAWLAKVAGSKAANINAATLAQIEAALSSDDEDDTPTAVFDRAEAQRTPSAATSLVTAYSAWATTEAAKQVSGGSAVKTWETGPHPRASHAALNGETVGLDDTFSNGLMWPGDGGDADEVAGCNCGVTVSIP